MTPGPLVRLGHEEGLREDLHVSHEGDREGEEEEELEQRVRWVEVTGM
jgi:hypothetical protein